MVDILQQGPRSARRIAELQVAALPAERQSPPRRDRTAVDGEVVTGNFRGLRALRCVGAAGSSVRRSWRTFVKVECDVGVPVGRW